MSKTKKVIKKTIKTALLWLIKPFIIPILILAFIFSIISSITDILYVAFHHEEEIDLAKEIKYYYSDGEYDKDEMKGFFSSVWDWVNDMLGGKEIAEDTEWPVEGHYTITCKFGPRVAPTTGASSNHGGIDIGAPEGSKLVCIMDGEVQSVGWAGANGYTIAIKSTDGKYVFSYSHSSPEFIVSVGQTVSKGEVIGKVGPKNVYGISNNPYRDSDGNPTNGATTGCHCHFSVREEGILIDPLTILNKEEESIL